VKNNVLTCHFTPQLYHFKEGFSMENNKELQAIKDRCGIDLLSYIIRSSLEHGCAAVPVDRLNEVILLTNGKVIDPKTFKELEVM
jgi:hypothetical protein